MQSISFSFRPEVTPERQEAVVAHIAASDAIAQVGQLSPGATHPAIRRMYYAYIKDEASPGAVAQRLAAIPELEEVELPAERRLI